MRNIDHGPTRPIWAYWLVASATALYIDLPHQATGAVDHHCLATPSKPWPLDATATTPSRRRKEAPPLPRRWDFARRWIRQRRMEGARRRAPRRLASGVSFWVALLHGGREGFLKLENFTSAASAPTRDAYNHYTWVLWILILNKQDTWSSG
jgi:hypothetical protein